MRKLRRAVRDAVCLLLLWLAAEATLGSESVAGPSFVLEVEGSSAEEVHKGEPRSAPDESELVRSMLEAGKLQEAIALARGLVVQHRESREPALATPLHLLGVALSSCGEDGEARPFLEQAVEIRQKAHPRDELALAASLIELARVLVGVGDFPSAAAHLDAALSFSEAEGGNESKTLADALSVQGSLYLAQVRYREAQPLLERALAIRRRIGLDLDVGRSLAQLASLFGEQSDRARELPLIDESIAIYERTSGAEHPGLIPPLILLGWDRLRRGELVQAQALVERQVRIAENVCGPNSPLSTAALLQRAWLNLLAQKSNAARTDADQALRIKERAIGAFSPRLAVWLRLQADVLVKAGDLSGAELALSRSLELAKATGFELITATTRTSLGILRLAQGSPDEARELFERSLEAYDAELGLQSTTSLPNLEFLINLALSRGESVGRIAPLLERAIPLSEYVNGAEFLGVAHMRLLLVPVLGSRGEIWLAETEARKAFQVFERKLGLASAELAQPLIVLGQAESAAGKHQEAHSHFDRAISLLRTQFGDSHPATASARIPLAQLFESLGDFAEAESLYRLAFTSLAAQLGPDHPAVGQASAGLASVALRSGKVDVAAQLYDQTIASVERTLGSESFSLAPLLATRAEILRIQGQLELAEEMFARATECVRLEPSAVLLSAQIDAGRAAVLGEMARSAEAAALFEQAVDVLKAGGETLHLAVVLQKQGSFLLALGSYEDAAKAFERADSFVQQLFGADHELRGHNLVGLGMVNEARGNFAAARTSYGVALSIWRTRWGENHPYVGQALMRLGQLALHRGELAAAEDAFRQALAIRYLVPGMPRPDLVQALLGLGNVLSRKAEYLTARSFIEEALATAKEAFGSRDPRLAGPTNSLGALFLEEGKFREATDAFKHARQLLEDGKQTESLNYAAVLESLGGCFIRMGRFREARPLLEQALKTRRDRLGPEHPDAVRSLASLASLLSSGGDFQGSRRASEAVLAILARAKEISLENASRIEIAIAPVLSQLGESVRARQVAQGAVETFRKVLGPSHPDIGDAIRGLGEILQQQGDCPAAIEAFRSALVVTEQSLGADHPRSGLILSDLGVALRCKGDPIAAREALERARRILGDSLGEESPVVGNVLFHLGSLLTGQGDLEAGEALVSRAAEIVESTLGPNHPSLISILSNLAINRFLLQRRDEAAMLLDRAVAIESAQTFGSTLPSVGWLCQIASAQAATSRTDLAKATYQRALERSVRPGQPYGLGEMELLMGQGAVSLAAGDLKAARTCLRSAQGIAARALEDHDPRLGLIVGNLGLLDWQEGRRTSARRRLLRAAEILRRGTETLLPSLSFAEQRAHLGFLTGYAGPYLLSFLGEGMDLKAVAARLLPSKGLLVESLRREVALNRASALEPRLAPRLERLRELRSEISGLHAAQRAMHVECKPRLRELSIEKERIEREVRWLHSGEDLVDPMSGLDLRLIQRMLAPDQAIVDLYRYQNLSGDKPVDEYSAVLIMPQRDPILVSLGRTTEIHGRLQYWRNLVLYSAPPLSEGATEVAWHELADRLWAPIVSKLAPTTRRIWISPDDELAGVPWHLFPQPTGGHPAHLVTQIDSLRELVRLISRGQSAARPGEPVALVVGGIDFGNDEKAQDQRFAFLPFSVAEVEAIRDLGLRVGLDVNLLTGTAPSEKKILDSLPQAEYVHVATHGFFARSAPLANSLDLTAAFAGLREPWMEVLSQARNPLAESGIAVAGANRRPSVTGESDGILTAEELVGIDLSRVLVLTLSGCDTGKGEEATGQGVLGLRSALLAAGARTLIMSVWKVPDEATQELMRRFYINLWERKLPPLPALLAAQKDLREDPSGEYTAPLNWAGWVLVGDAW